MNIWAHRICAGCSEDLGIDEFSKNQWRKPPRVSRCKLCVSENVRRNGDGISTQRSNENSNRASFDWDARPYSSGTFRNVYIGQYTGGSRTGQSAVAKLFKRQHRDMSEHYFENDRDSLEKALELISSFNSANLVSSKIRLNIPERWSGVPNTSGPDQDFLVEPYIPHYTKFNSNSGWVARDSGRWHDILQALSHYSYHVSRGQFTLCDIQGGIFRDGVVLSDPAVLSKTGRFGPTDLGDRGISTFFARHRCSRFCRRYWSVPRNRVAYFKSSQGSSMIKSEQASMNQDYSKFTFTVPMIKEEEESPIDYGDSY